jgi:sulfide:quinone oxidoreductase
MHTDQRVEIVIVGGGIAALEAMIALHDLAPARAHVTLVAPGPDAVLPAMKVGESFGLGRRERVVLTRAADDFGATYVADRVVAVDAVDRSVRCGDGARLPYDSLILALGAQALPAFDEAQTVGEDAADELLHGILADLEEGYLKDVVFVAPGSAAWTLPLYELALLTAADAWSMGIDDARLTIASPEERPLALFGPSCSAAVARGFVAVDPHGRVLGTHDIFAAGDITAFPVKQGGLAAQQAEAAAEAVAARHGCAIDPEPFRPVLRGKLATGDGDLFLVRDIAGGAGEGVAGPGAAWWPPSKTFARRLSPYLFGVREAEPAAR